METWKIGVIFAVLAVLAIGVVTASSDDITATVTVPAVCIVDLSTNSIGFGSINPGGDTAAVNQEVTVTNIGSTQADNTTIEGTQWSDGGTNNFVVGQTEYDTSGFTYGDGTALTSSAVAISGGNLNNGASLTLHFGVGVPASQTAALYTQTITVTMNC